MTPRLIIRPAAVDDLEELAIWIGNDSPAVAGRFLENCQKEFDRLAEMPHLGRLRQFANSRAAGIRTWAITGFPNHLVFYRSIEGGAEILHVLHGARDIDALFERNA
jgi:toxin ParE1/3/4